MDSFDVVSPWLKNIIVHALVIAVYFHRLRMMKGGLFGLHSPHKFFSIVSNGGDLEELPIIKKSIVFSVVSSI
jgi:hypothetical protein